MIRVIRGNVVSAPKCGELSIVEHGAVVLEDGKIVGVFDHVPERFSDAETEDWGDRLVLQGFSDMHLHAPQYPMLGMGMDLPLLEWLNRYTFKVESHFQNLDYAERVYRELVERLVAGGTTRVCMFSSLHTDATLLLMRILEDAGICGYVGKVNMDRNSASFYQETTEESKRETLRWLDASEQFDHIKPILTPRFTPSCSDGLMEWLGNIARERDLPVQSHISENVDEIRWVRELHPDCERYWETYAKYGLWKPGTIMAHCVYSDETERKAMLDCGVTAVHCADSNFNVVSGIAPVRQLLQDGIPVAIGSDIAGGAQLFMPQVMQMSIRASKVQTIASEWKTDFLSVAEAYYLGTSAGAVYCGQKPGFAGGDPLHAVVVDDTDWLYTNRLTIAERFERAIYLCRPENIQAVYGNGKRIK